MTCARTTRWDISYREEGVDCACATRIVAMLGRDVIRLGGQQASACVYVVRGLRGGVVRCLELAWEEKGREEKGRWREMRLHHFVTRREIEREKWFSFMSGVTG